MLDKLKNFVLDQFPEPSDVYSAIHPLYIYSKLMGLACYTTKMGNRKRYSVTPAAMLQHVLTVLVLAGLSGYNFFAQDNTFFGTALMKNLQYFQDAISNILMTTELVFVVVFAKKIVQVFKNIDEVDKWFKSLGVFVSYKTTYIAAISSVISGVVLTMAVVWTLILLELSENIFTAILWNVVNFCPYLINFVFQFQYLQYTMILTRKYKILNKYLKTLLHADKAHNSIVTAWTTKSEKFYVLDKIRSNVSKDPVLLVDTVAAMHIKLKDTAMLINNAFCVQLLLSITTAFLGLVTALFLIAVNFSRPPTDETASWNVIFTAWAFSVALFLVATVYVTCNLCEKANKCPKILHRIRNVSNNRELNDVIEIYSLQMYHNRLQFHVCGLFPLDYTLLYAIVAGITTYLVILIQFNNAPYSKKVLEIESNSTLMANTSSS